MDVVVVRLPDEVGRRTDLARAARPRLLLVEPGHPPPECIDPLEDWIRLPADDGDVRARVSTLAARSEALRPTLDTDGLLRFRGRWVPLSPVERVLAECLLAHYGVVAGRDTLCRRAWPGEPPSRNALDVHMVRLRRRIAVLGLEVRTVRSRGYLLQVADLT